MTKTSNSKCRIRNWKEYNKALVNRGSLTIWFSSDTLEKWHAELNAKRGRPRIYSDEAILCALMIKSVYKLPFRALRGLMLSMIVLFGLNLKIPCYTRVCRRAAELGQKIKQLGDKKVAISKGTFRPWVDMRKRNPCSIGLSHVMFPQV